MPHKKYRIAYNDSNPLWNHHPRCGHPMNPNKVSHRNKSR
nr:MAG TPA: hypothetical protein [Caudoviricetes sp.]